MLAVPEQDREARCRFCGKRRDQVAGLAAMPVETAGQKIALGRIHAGRIVTVHVAEHTVTIDLDGDDTRTFRRTRIQTADTGARHRAPAVALLASPSKSGARGTLAGHSLYRQ
jgi:hypothetical protein